MSVWMFDSDNIWTVSNVHVSAQLTHGHMDTVHNVFAWWPPCQIVIYCYQIWQEGYVPQRKPTWGASIACTGNDDDGHKR